MLKFQDKVRNAKQKITTNDRLIKKMIIANFAVAVIGFHSAAAGFNLAANFNRDQDYFKYLKNNYPDYEEVMDHEIELSKNYIDASLAMGTASAVASVVSLCASVPLIKQFDKNQSNEEYKRRDFDVTKSFDA